MDARSPGTRAKVLLNNEAFDLITAALGCESEGARARLLDVDPKTVYRARRGVIGEEFIAKTLSVMKANEQRLGLVGITPNFESVFVLAECGYESKAA